MGVIKGVVCDDLEPNFEQKDEDKGLLSSARDKIERKAVRPA